MDKKQDLPNTSPNGQYRLPRQEPDLGKKFSIKGILRRGTNQYNPMPKEQQFTPPPQSAYVANTPLPTQPIAAQTQKTPRNWFLVKIIFLIMILLLLIVIIVSATLYYTEYIIFTPAAPIKNIIDSIFSNIPKFSLNLPLPDLPFLKK